MTKKEDTEEYAIVIQYVEMGSLRQNLSSIAQMPWEKKLGLISSIVFDLQLIHSHDIIHCDLHSDNIFQSSLYSAYIGDLGFAKIANKILVTESKGVYGALPYIAPEILRGKSFTKVSDVYSLGMIMWEISSGRIAFSEYEKELSLAIDICEGLRPQIIKGTTLCYANLLRQCWNSIPENRPSALEIYETIMTWKNDAKILSEFKNSDKMIELNQLKHTTFNINSDIYTSKFINYITDSQQSNESISVISDNITIEEMTKKLNSISMN
jgi:serine/threonine protein kinase